MELRTVVRQVRYSCPATNSFEEINERHHTLNQSMSARHCLTGAPILHQNPPRGTVRPERSYHKLREWPAHRGPEGPGLWSRAQAYGTGRHPVSAGGSVSNLASTCSVVVFLGAGGGGADRPGRRHYGPHSSSWRGLPRTGRVIVGGEAHARSCIPCPDPGLSDAVAPDGWDARSPM